MRCPYFTFTSAACRCTGIYKIFLFSQSLMDYCFKFAYQHMTQVALSDGFSELDGALAKQFVVKAAETGVFKT